jgi:hypothetical protein
MNLLSILKDMLGAPGPVNGHDDGPPIHHPERLDQARILAEVARRTAEPVDALPRGNAGAACLLLWREAALWALSAASVDGDPPGELAELWQKADSRLLAVAAGGDAFVSAMRQIFLEQTRQGDLEAEPAAVRRAGEFVSALITALGAGERARIRRWLRRARRPALFVGAPLALVLLWLVWPRPNLATSRPYRLSSSQRACTELFSCGNAFFHTQDEDSPWIEYDLGEPTVLHRVEVANRSDCCGDRTLPLVVELSLDRNNWQEVARITEPFTVWKHSLDKPTARYVRLRVARHSTLHLAGVVIR